MPMYEYQCPKCERVEHALRSIDLRNNSPRCGACNARTALTVSAVAGVVKNPAVTKGGK